MTDRIHPDPFHHFAKKHGDFVQDNESGYAYFADGARCTGQDGSRLQTFTDPPTDGYELLRAKRLYLQIALNQEVNSFESFQQACLSQANLVAKNNWGSASSCCPPPPADAKAQLLAGKKRIAELRDRLAHKDKLLADTPQAQALREQQEAHQQQQEANRQQVNELANLTP